MRIRIKDGVKTSESLDALRDLILIVFKEAMGAEFSEAFIKLKMGEWNSYVSHFSNWEKENTLDV